MQSALRHSPGNHSAVVLYKVNKEEDRVALTAAAAKLIRYFNDEDVRGTDVKHVELAQKDEGSRKVGLNMRNVAVAARKVASAARSSANATRTEELEKEAKAAEDFAKTAEAALKDAQEAGIVARRTPGDVHVLVGFGLEHLLKTKLTEDIDEAQLKKAGGLFEELHLEASPMDIFVQVSAWSEGDRLFALRVVRELLTPFAKCKAEFFGNRIRDGEEPFGFTDGAPSREARNSVTSPVGSWLMLQHYQQDVTKFYDETQETRTKLMGRPPASAHKALADNLVSNLGKDEGHARRMASRGYGQTLLRRGFPCQRDGEEGLAFIAVAAVPSILSDALKLFIGHPRGEADPLQPYTSVTHNSLYFCPGINFIADVQKAEPGAAAQSMRNPLDLISYEMPLAAYYYMDALLYMAPDEDESTFLKGDANKGHDLTAAAKASLDEIEARVANDPRVRAYFRDKLGNQNLSHEEVRKIIRGLREAAKDDANEINRLLRDYFTIA